MTVTQVNEDVKICVLSHLSALKFLFEKYFPGLEIENYDHISVCVQSLPCPDDHNSYSCPVVNKYVYLREYVPLALN